MICNPQTALLLAGVAAVMAAPLDEPESKHRLFARGAKWHASCDRKIPGSDETMKTKAQRAFTGQCPSTARIALEFG